MQKQAHNPFSRNLELTNVQTRLHKQLNNCEDPIDVYNWMIKKSFKHLAELAKSKPEHLSYLFFKNGIRIKIHYVQTGTMFQVYQGKEHKFLLTFPLEYAEPKY